MPADPHLAKEPKVEALAIASESMASSLASCKLVSFSVALICHVRKLSAVVVAACGCSSNYLIPRTNACYQKSIYLFAYTMYAAYLTACRLCEAATFVAEAHTMPCDKYMHSAISGSADHAVCLSLCLSVCPSVCLSVSLFVCVFMCLSVCLSVCLWEIQQGHLQLAAAGRARLLSVLKPSEGGLLWRTAKADVAHELGLPPQHQQTSSLQFSAIERHFYSRQHADCTSRASFTINPQLLSQAAQGGPGGVVGHRRLTAAEEKKLLFPLLRLRQACCHPQVGSLPLLCCAVVCCAVLCCAVPWGAVPWRAVLCRAVLCCAVCFFRPECPT